MILRILTNCNICVVVRIFFQINQIELDNYDEGEYISYVRRFTANTYEICSVWRRRVLPGGKNSVSWKELPGTYKGNESGIFARSCCVSKTFDGNHRGGGKCRHPAESRRRASGSGTRLCDRRGVPARCARRFHGACRRIRS